MSEIDQDEERLLRDTFERYRAEQVPTLTGPGAEATHRMLARRRRRRTGMLAAVLLMVLAGGTAAIAILQPDRQHRHRTPPATGYTSSPAPYTHSPSPTPKTGGSRSTAPNGRIGIGQLANSTLDIPGWPGGSSICAGGRYRFQNGSTGGGGPNPAAGAPDFYLPSAGVYRLPGPSYVDLDGDGAAETVVVLACGDHHAVYQAVAFDRGADGQIVTMGAVATIDSADVAKLDGLRQGPDNTISVRWTQQHQTYPISHWCRYRWTGKSFRLVSGSTKLPSKPAVTVTGTASMSSTEAGYQGTLTATITNSGSSANTVGSMDVEVDLPSGVTATSVAPSASCSDSATSPKCSLGSDLRPGESVTVTLQLVSTADHQQQDQHLRANVTVQDDPMMEFTSKGNGSVPVTLPAAS